MDLNKLPIDMLIKLICTIEKDTREKIFAEKWSIYITVIVLLGFIMQIISGDASLTKENMEKEYVTNAIPLSHEVKERYVKCEHYTEI